MTHKLLDRNREIAAEAARSLKKLPIRLFSEGKDFWKAVIHSLERKAETGFCDGTEAGDGEPTESDAAKLPRRNVMVTDSLSVPMQGPFKLIDVLPLGTHRFVVMSKGRNAVETYRYCRFLSPEEEVGQATSGD